MNRKVITMRIILTGHTKEKYRCIRLLHKSLNLPAVWLLHEIGLQKGYDKAEEFGLPLAKSDKYYGLALGGLEKGVSPMIMAGAYSAFANEGQMYTPHLITKNR